MARLTHGEDEAEESVIRGLRLAVVLSFGILVVESIGALFSRSLSLTVDAVHNLPDLLAFAVSYSALAATERGADRELTFGAHRFEVFAGFFNGALVLGTGLVFAFTAVVALRSGTSFAGAVDPWWILFAAAPTLGLRAVSLAVLGRVPRRVQDLNLRSVIVHLASDLLITGALIADGLVLLLRPGYLSADAGAALVIAGILVYESFPLFRGTWEVLTESVPRHLSVARIMDSVRAVPSVQEVHDVHVWAVCPTLVCMTAHVRVSEQSVQASMTVVRELRRRMEEEFGILHAVFELEA
ncbi:MAG: cation diffusion facilitator family transporter [Thermoplasmata archaeon]|nr:cation diffusion facilitator family transporter [Thermoplasmata archaeon]